MPDPTTVQRLRGLVLSANDLKELNPEWHSAMIEDYLNIIDNLITLANLLDIEIDQKIEEISTDFLNGSIPFAKDGHLVEENPGLSWVDAVKELRVVGDILTQNIHVSGQITGQNRAKQYFMGVM